MKSERAATPVAELAVDAKRRRGAELEQKAGINSNLEDRVKYEYKYV